MVTGGVGGQRVGGGRDELRQTIGGIGAINGDSNSWFVNLALGGGVHRSDLVR